MDLSRLGVATIAASAPGPLQRPSSTPRASPVARLSLNWRLITDQGDKDPQTVQDGPRVPITAERVELRMEMDYVTTNRARLSWRAPGQSVWQVVGEPFELKFDWRTGTFQGPQVAMFCFSTRNNGSRRRLRGHRLVPLQRQALITP